jgi:nucleoside-diphosphate-sugar epimerase
MLWQIDFYIKPCGNLEIFLQNPIFELLTISITGASGYLGQNLVNSLSNTFNDLKIKVLIHRNYSEAFNKPNVINIRGDLLKPESLTELLEPGCTVVNLAYLHSQTQKANLEAINNLAEASAKVRIKRFVHCSTAVVVGDVLDDQITEETACFPKSVYEISKFKIEELLREKSYSHFELLILRPSAIFGPDGKNLLKLADNLVQGNKVINYLKSCFNNHRKMNLVYIDNVVSALVFLINLNQTLEMETFIVSDDESPINNYRDIEKYLIKKLGRKDYFFPRIPFPKVILRALLKLAARSNTNPNRVYQCCKLMGAGLKKPIAFEDGLETFANWYNKRSFI